MDYIKDTFSRMNLQQLRNFLLYGTEDFDDTAKPYNVVLKTNSDAIFERLANLYPDEEERDKAVSDLTQALSAYESVYMELGMKAGARIVCQLLFTEDKL